MEIIYPWNVYRSEASRIVYRRASRHFLEFGGYVNPRYINHRRGLNPIADLETAELEKGIRELVQEARDHPEKVRETMVSFIKYCNQRIDRGEISHELVHNNLKPIRIAFDMNDIPFAWRKLMKLMHVRNYPKDREYTLDEIRLMLSKATPHLRIAILLMASSGIRVGAFNYMKVRDVEPLIIDGKTVCGKLTVYAGEGKDEYVTLISKEAYDEWTAYLDRRGNPPPDAPAITDRAEKNSLRPNSIQRALNLLLWRTGLRKEKKKRHEVQIAHGFRKFFDNVAKDYMDEPYVEKLMGHDTGTKEHYDRHLPKPAIEQYLRAMPFLSISEAYRQVTVLEKQLEAAEGQNRQEMTELRLQVLESEKKQRELEKEKDELKSTIEGQGKFLKDVQEQIREIRKKIIDMD